MESASPTIDDLISRGIPGAIVTAAPLVGLSTTELHISANNLTLITFLAVSYTVGTFIDLHKHDYFRSPPHFRKVLYSETGEEGYLRWVAYQGLRFRNSRFAMKFNSRSYLPDIASNPSYERSSPFSENGLVLSEILEEKEYLDVSPDNLNEVWIEFERITLPELGRIGNNQHTVYHFLLNFFVAVTVSSLLLILGMILYNPISTSLILLLFLFLLALLVIEVNLFGRYSRRYTERLLSTYFKKVQKESQ